MAKRVISQTENSLIWWKFVRGQINWLWGATGWSFKSIAFPNHELPRIIKKAKTLIHAEDSTIYKIRSVILSSGKSPSPKFASSGWSTLLSPLRSKPDISLFYSLTFSFQMTSQGGKDVNREKGSQPTFRVFGEWGKHLLHVETVNPPKTPGLSRYPFSTSLILSRRGAGPITTSSTSELDLGVTQGHVQRIRHVQIQMWPRFSEGAGG